MKANLVRIGNSRGIRLPKPLIEQAGFGDEVEIRVRPGAIVIERIQGTRTGWSEAARELRKRGDDRLLEPPIPTRFDRDEWKW